MKKHIFIILLLFFSVLSAEEKTKFHLISDEPRYIEREKMRYFETLIELREFKIGKKHCLWGSKNFDDKCQDAAMEYAYGMDWKEHKKTALDFISYSKVMDVEKLIALFDFHTFYIYLPKLNEDGNYIPGMGPSLLRPLAINTPSHCRKLLTKKIMQDWNKALQGAEYKNFLLVKPDRLGSYVIELTRYITIRFEIEYGRYCKRYVYPNIAAVEYY
jgi:hypothetical protein